jgi:hypothetical protein
LLQDLPDWDDNDIWTYSRRSPWYSSSKAYKQQIGYRAVHPVSNWLWKSTVQKKHNVFFLLLLKDRLSTRNILRRKNRVLPSYDCVLYAAPTKETLQHLFLTCPFAQLCWNLIHLAAVQPGDPFLCLTEFRNQLAVSFSMDIIILMSWFIWMEWNDVIFKGTQPALNNVKARFKKEFALVIHLYLEQSQPCSPSFLHG